MKEFGWPRFLPPTKSAAPYAFSFSIGLLALTPSQAFPATPPIGAPKQGVIAQPPRYSAPTPSLTAVANGMALKLKSLNMLITVAPNLPIAQGVEISIASFFPNTAPSRTTQSYVRSTGNRFLFVDSERDGKPRPVRFDISLAERGADGKLIPFGFTWQVTLDPLYDVDIGVLRFELIDNCDVGKGAGEIVLRTQKPDGVRLQLEYKMYPGEHRDLKEFAWSGKEISASAKLQRPALEFWEDDGIGPPATYIPPFGGIASGVPLVPGRTRAEREVQKAKNAGCKGRFVYQINYNLRRYPYLD